MSGLSKKVVVPPHLLRRLEAFRIVKGDDVSYLLRDKVLGNTYDMEAWQFFILEVLPGYETIEKLQSAFRDRFDRAITAQEINEVLAGVADRKLFDESAAQHPLLAPFLRRTYDVVEGKAQARLHAQAVAGGSATAGTPQPVATKVAAVGAGTRAEDPAAELPAGIQDAFGLDWRTTKRMLRLFDPRPLLRIATPLVAPLRHTVYLVPLLTAVAVILLVQYSHLLMQDLSRLHPQISLFEHLLFVMVTVHLVVQLTAAFVAHHYGVTIPKFGIGLYFGFMPRFVVHLEGAEKLNRQQTMWLHGSTLLVRMVMFSLGVLLWYNSRDSQGMLAQTGLLLAGSCAVGLLLESGNPLVKGNGYFLLCAYLNEPHLRGKSYAALRNRLTGEVYRAADNKLLALYALASSTYAVLIILALTWVLLRFMQGHLDIGGSAILLAGGFAGYLLWRNYVGLKRFGETYKRQMQFDRWRTRTLPVKVAEEGEAGRQQPNYWKRVLLIGLLLVLFLPYPYEPGGPFSVFPVRRASIASDTPGVVSAVYFNGGEFVKEGTVLARLAHDDYLSRVRVLDAQIAEQKHVIADLKSRPKPEEVKLAQERLDAARLREPFSRERVPRLEKLYAAGAVTFEELDAARKQHVIDMSDIAEKEAALALAKTGATPSQVAAAEAKLVALIEEREGYIAKIERTALRMPFDGNILTLHLKDRTNSYLDKGASLATVENTGFVTAEIELMESDLQYVKVGSPVRARTVSYFDDEFRGQVTLIDRNVTPKSFGNVVKVLATIENEDGRLKTGMTGQAKIDAGTMPVWQAFTLSLARFVKIQLWSWIP